MANLSTEASGSEITKGVISFLPSTNRSALNVLSPNFLVIDWRLVYNDGTIYWSGAKQIMYATNLTQDKVWPETWWLPAEKIAKSAWSTVLVDLGQIQESNILLDSSFLASFTSDFVQKFGKGGNVQPGPETSPYDPAQTRTGPLGTTSAVIATDYICNIPRRKPVSTILWSVILADLVFLQAVWTVFKLVVDTFLLEKKTKLDRTTSSEYLLVPTKRNTLNRDRSKSITATVSG